MQLLRVVSLGFLPLLAGGASASERVLPIVSGGGRGSNSSYWASEIRVSNLSTADKQVRVTSVLHANTSPEPWLPLIEFPVPAGATVAFGGASFFRWGDYGAITFEADPDLVIQTSVLSGRPPDHFDACGPIQCRSYGGGFGTCDDNGCNLGAGPVIDALDGAFPPETPFILPWLHTDEARRTNLLLLNPDPSDATVTLTVMSTDGQASRTATVSVPSYGVLQLDDLFAREPWLTIRNTNFRKGNVAARASLISTTRLLAIGFVIANQNNTVGVSLPRLAPGR